MTRICVECLATVQTEPACFCCDCGCAFVVAIVGYSVSAGQHVQLVRPELPEADA